MSNTGGPRMFSISPEAFLLSDAHPAARASHCPVFLDNACLHLLNGCERLQAYPLDLVRTRLSAQTTSNYYTGISHALRAIVHDEGFLGLYRGLGATLLQIGPSLALNYCAYETLRSHALQLYPDYSSPTVGCRLNDAVSTTPSPSAHISPPPPPTPSLPPSNVHLPQDHTD